MVTFFGNLELKNVDTFFHIFYSPQQPMSGTMT